MLTWGKDIHGQTNAIWETYYLSGVRPEELPQLQMKHIIKDNNGIISIKFIDSKSMAREIPLPQTPYKLLEYIEMHPQKNNKEAPLFFPLKNQTRE